MATTEDCAYDCKHPLWGGDGICVAKADDATTYHCECNDGFVSRDAMGNPSCVLQPALITGYVLVTLTGLGATLFLIGHALRYRDLPLSIRATRRAMLRLRLTLSASVYAGGCTIVFCIAAALGGNSPLWGGGICEMFVTAVLPFRAVAIMMVAALWVNSLPSQVLPPTSFAVRLKEFVETRHVFGVLGLVGMAVMLSIGMYSWFHPAKAMRLADVLSALGEALVGFCIVFVAAQTFHVIDRCQGQAQESEATTAFYKKAKRTLIKQMLAICFAIVIFLVATWALHFTVAGMYTAVIPLVIRFVDGLLSLCAAAHFTRSDRPKARKQANATTTAAPSSPPSSSSPPAWGRSSWRQVLKVLRGPSAAASKRNRLVLVNSRSGTGGAATVATAKHKTSVSETVIVPTVADSTP